MAKSETSKNIDIEALLGKTSERTSKEVNIEPKEEFKKEKAPVVEEKAPVVEETASEKNARIADEALKNAAATAALKAAIDANSQIALNNSEREYVIQKKKYMLNKCKEDEVVKFTGNKIYAQYFGKVYSFMYNTIPVVVKFDGSTQGFPRFVYEEIMRRIQRFSEASTPKKVDVELN